MCCTAKRRVSIPHRQSKNEKHLLICAIVDMVSIPHRQSKNWAWAPASTLAGQVSIPHRQSKNFHFRHVLTSLPHVSIPHRQSKNFYLPWCFWDFTNGFQFLIGSLRTALFPYMFLYLFLLNRLFRWTKGKDDNFVYLLFHALLF